MLLDRVDIDAHGPLSRVELGPLAEHLNVVCGPEGSGKTAIARFIRDSLVHRRYPLGMMNSSTGRVVWADRNGKIHCRREQDGTNDGRRTIEFESRGDQRNHYRSLEHSWLSGITKSTDASRAAGSVQLPESIVDCVITDTAVSNVARIVSACVRNGLDSPETYRSLPLAEDARYLDRDPSEFDQSRSPGSTDRHRDLRAQLADVEAELSRIESDGADYHSLISRRNELTARLGEGEFTRRNAIRGDAPNGNRRLGELSDQADRLRRRQCELRRWIAELDAELSRIRASYHTPYRFGDHSYANYRDTLHRSHANLIDNDLRRRLDDLDAQMIRWRRTLMEVHGLRDAVLRSRDSFDDRYAPADDVIRRRERLDGFLHTIDRYADYHYGDSNHYFDHVYRAQSNADEIESRIDAATRQIDWLLDRYQGDGIHYDWYRSLPPSAAYRATASLSDSLQAIRNDLRQVAGATRRQHDYHQRTNAELAVEVARRRQSEGRFRTTSQLTETQYANNRLDELRDCEQWLVSAIEQLTIHRESLLRDFAASKKDAGVADPGVSYNIHLWDAAGFEQERDRRVSELDHVTAQLHRCLNEASHIRRTSRVAPIHGSEYRYEFYGDHVSTYPMGRFQESVPGIVGNASWIDDEAIRSEIQRIDKTLASHSREQWLRTRRAELLGQLQVVRHPSNGYSPLAEDASRWLIRLSAGRLRRVEWNSTEFRTTTGRRNHHTDTDAIDANGARLYPQAGVRIDGRDEAMCSAAERAIATLAVRLAAGDLLARTGRAVPLVIETWRELIVDAAIENEYSFASNPYSLRGYDHQYHGTPLSFYQYGDDRQSNHPIVAALNDYTRAGRQVVVLTSDIALSDQIDRAGGRRFDLHGEKVVHPHRPLWKSSHDAESYVGPHPHTYGFVRTPSGSDVNRNFDVAWREEYGIDDGYSSPAYRSPGSLRRTRTDWAPDGVDYRDGYYYTDTYTTTSGKSSPCEVINGEVRQRKVAKPESPFFLSVDSPIDQAPSIDAIAAARLRGLNVSHVNHLMQQDPNRLSDALGLANVDAATIRRWQSECRLVCRVPQLRGFDARILVGCGITDPAQLAAIAPVDLLDRVKNFLATEHGQRILLSGSSYELSRITSWIAAANGSNSGSGYGRDRIGFRKFSTSDGRSGGRAIDRSQSDLEIADFDNARYEYQYFNGSESGRRRRNSGRGRGRAQTAAEINRDLNEIDSQYDDDGRRDGPVYRDSASGRGRRRSNRRDRSERSGRELVRLADERLSESYRSGDYDDEHSGRSGGRSDNRRSSRRRSRDGRGSRSSRREGEYRSRSSRSESSSERRSSKNRSSRTSHHEARDHEKELRFYLQRDSDVVDAPSIGARMAERLNAIGIYTVNDLLQADAESAATELDYRKVDADTIVAWQQQAALVCRVPMLRGHDAQLLVAAEVTSPEELVTYTPDDLFALIKPISHSSEGKRILRGGKLPDLEEVTEWISYGQHQRELMAA